MSIAFTEIRRAKLKFGLLAGAVSLLVFLVLFLTAISSALVNSFTGALAGVQGEVLVYSDTARDNLQASRLRAEVVEQVSQVEGVAVAGPLSLLTTAAALPDGSGDLQLVAAEPDRPGAPTGLTSGTLPQKRGEIATDGGGLALGDTVTLTESDEQLTVVGLLKGAQFNAAPTGYVTQAEIDKVVRANNPQIPFVPINGVAVELADGADAAAVAQRISDEVPGVTGYVKEDAVALIPGVASVSQTFGILVGLTFVIGIVVIGFFFLILTVQKLRSFTLLRAIGASTGRLAGVVATQIAVVVLVASVIAVLLTVAAVRGLSTGLPVTLPAALVVGVVAAVLLCSLGAGLLSIRRITAIDPATAAGAR